MINLRVKHTLSLYGLNIGNGTGNVPESEVISRNRSQKSVAISSRFLKFLVFFFSEGGKIDACKLTAVIPANKWKAVKA